MVLRAIISGAFTVLLMIGGGNAQVRFEGEHGGRFRGFTKSPGEHIMNEFPGLPEVREVRGRIVDTTGAGLSGALFEIRIEDPTGRVRGTVSKHDGSFHFRSVADGVYSFKVTLRGFQSTYGTLKVNRRAPGRNVLHFQLQPGV